MERDIQDIPPSENTVKERRKFEDIVEFLILDTALAFIVILLLEQAMPRLRAAPQYYRSMRRQVTALVSLLHVGFAVWLLLSA